MKSISLSLLGLFLVACSCNINKEQKPLAKHVILIGVDGMSPNGVIQANTPIMDEMMKNGAHSFHARSVLPSSSGANWASMLNGAGPEQHGVISNNWKTDNFILPATVVKDAHRFPSIFTVIRDQKPNAVIGAIYDWEPIVNFFEPSAVDYSISPKDEDETTLVAIDYIKEHTPDFTFIHLDHVDHYGHSIGHGTPAYYHAVEKADSLIGEIIQATKDAGTFEETVFIISSDHGGVGKGHGGETMAEVEIPFIVSGKNVKENFTSSIPINTYDTPATVAFVLGLDIPFEWIGRPVKSVFVGQPEPKLMYSSNVGLMKPVIYPAANEYDPAGGLFVEETATLALSNPNTTGEIRFTLDGKQPTVDSELYTNPISIEKTTIVKAQIFEHGKSISDISTGYFRILKSKNGHGISYKTYEKDDLVKLPDFSNLKASSSGTTFEFNLNDVKLPRDESVALVMESHIEINKAGKYTFYLASDDGSKLYINNKEVVDNDGDHGVIERNGSIELDAGKHEIRVEWFNGGGGKWLGAFYQGPEIPKQIIEPSILFTE